VNHEVESNGYDDLGGEGNSQCQGNLAQFVYQDSFAPFFRLKHNSRAEYINWQLHPSLTNENLVNYYIKSDGYDLGDKRDQGIPDIEGTSHNVYARFPPHHSPREAMSDHIATVREVSDAVS
jgi:hypothetical protein